MLRLQLNKVVETQKGDLPLYDTDRRGRAHTILTPTVDKVQISVLPHLKMEEDLRIHDRRALKDI